MRNVNNKYFIQNEIDIEENFSDYIVIDSEENKRYILYVLKNDFTYEKSREYLLSKFKTIKNLNFDNIVNLIDIQIVYSIDGIKLDKPQYGYLAEYIESNVDTEIYLKQCTLVEKMDIFMEICSAINTLNIKGYVFDYITIKDIKLVTLSNNKVHVKIKNLLQYELSKFRLSNLSMGNSSLPYPYNIEKREEGSTNKDNIGQVISIFNNLFEEELKVELEELRDINKIYNQVNSFNKSYKLKHFIKYINEKMHKSYELFNYDALNKIQTNLDLINMEDELQKIEKSFQKILESKDKYRIISFSGENGCGKSRLLREIKYSIESKCFKNVIYIPNLNNFNMNMENIYDNVLNYIYKQVDKGLRDKYEIYIKKFIQILFEKDSITTEDSNNQKFQLINRVGKFLREYTISEPLIILIDDLDEKSETFKLFIRYISFLENNLENIMIIFSSNESKYDTDFKEFIKELKTLEGYEEYKINYFNQYNTTKMVKSILNPSKSINKLAIKIYSETLGNPQFIGGVIEELYKNNILYLSKETGEWKTRVNVKDIVIPKTLEKSLEMSISSLSVDEINILKRLSIFTVPLSEKIILTYIITELNDVKVYDELKSKGFLIYKISDRGILIDFSNNLLKNILYLKLDKEKKINMHSNACKFFEEILFETDYYMDEFLMHLEKCKNYEKIYFYSVKCAQISDILGNSLKAINYYKKALKSSSALNSGMISIDIARLYQRIADDERAYKYFNKANEVAVQQNDSKLQIYALIQMIIIKINESTFINLDYPINVVRELLNKTPYIKGEIYYFYTMALKYIIEYNNDLALMSAQKALIICEENKIYDDIYGWIKVAISDVYIKQNKCEEAKTLLTSATDIFMRENNNNGCLVSKLAYTHACKMCGESLQEILNKYFDIKRLSNKYKLYKKEIFTLICIGCIYTEEKKYKEAEKHLLIALEREREEGIDVYSAKICNDICLVYIKAGQIKSAIKYYYLAKQMQKVIKLSEEDVISFNSTSALYNLLIFNYDEASIYLDDIYALISNRGNKNFRNIICKYYELMLYKCESQEEIKKIYYKLNNEIEKLEDLSSVIEIRLNVIRKILDLGYRDFAKELFLALTYYPRDYDLEAKYIFLEFNFRYENYYNSLINKALRICAFINNQETKADLYSIIGEKYNQLKCYVLAANYYYESIDLQIDIINSLPENDKIPYINNSGFLKTRKLFIECLNNLLKVNISFSKLERIENILQVNKILNELKLKNILSNQKIFELVQELYEKCYYNNLNNIYKVFEKFSNDTISNLKNIIKYMARITLADKAMLVIENSAGENEVICTYRISDKNEINRYFSLKVDSGEDKLIICNHDTRFNQLDEKILKDGLKSCIYLKLRNKEKGINNNGVVNARLILISNNAINYINSNSQKIIEQFTPFLLFLLEKYKLTISSTLDKLTEVYNRKYFEESLINMIESAEREKSEFSIIMFDIDDFKSVNDKYGHQKGDEVLIKLTREVKKCLTKKDIIGRYGGEEFIIILPNTDKEQSLIIAENIRSRVEQSKILGDKRKVTISMGLAMRSRESINGEEIIKRADQALYMAKYQGKNRCKMWETDCGISSNINNELTGVLSGNATKDYNLALQLKDVINLVKCKSTREQKIYEFITKVLQVIECETVTVFIITDKQIINLYSKKRGIDGWYSVEKFNLKLVYQTLEEEKGRYLVDWTNMDNNNRYGIPDWKSICILPVMCNGEIISILYLSVSVNEKEFTYNEYNLLNCFAEIGTPIFY